MAEQEAVATKLRGSQGIPDLLIEAAMVNPGGKKERLGVSVPMELLNQEWVQIRNTTERWLILDGLELRHLTYDVGRPKLVKVFTLQGKLPGKAVMRIHSGRGDSHYEAARNLIHVFINPKRGHFQYQIIRNDTLAVVHANGLVVDQADYYVPLPENLRLKRVAPIGRRLLQVV